MMFVRIRKMCILVFQNLAHRFRQFCVAAIEKGDLFMKMTVYCAFDGGCADHDASASEQTCERAEQLTPKGPNDERTAGFRLARRHGVEKLLSVVAFMGECFVQPSKKVGRDALADRDLRSVNGNRAMFARVIDAENPPDQSLLI